MIVFSIYFLIPCFLIYKTNLFGVLKDNVLTPKFYLLAFVIKCLGISIFYLVYSRFYGGLFNSDTAHFYNDSKLIHDVAGWNFTEFLKIMLGFENAPPESELFKRFIEPTRIWDKNPEEFLYNDNRLIIRLHVLIHFISFGNYFVHALVNCLISFIGINWIYKTFKFIFSGKEISLFLVWLIFPGLWFWSAGVLKEGPALFLMGLLLISLKRILIDKLYTKKNILLLIFSVVFCFFLKHYVMLPLLFLSAIFFMVVSVNKIKYKSISYLIVLILFLIVGNLFLKVVFKQDVVSLLSKRQNTFLDVSKGGIFMKDDKKFVRLAYDTSLITPTSFTNEYVPFFIKKGVSFMYWEHSHQQDTLYCKYNMDTLNAYLLNYYFAPAKATIKVQPLENNYYSLFMFIPQALYFTLLKPFFYDSRNTLDMVESIENLIILISLLTIIFCGIKYGFKNPWMIYFLSITFSVLIIIGISSPNIGAIERYRALVIPFILMWALMSLKQTNWEQIKLFQFFKSTLNQN